MPVGYEVVLEGLRILASIVIILGFQCITMEQVTHGEKLLAELDNALPVSGICFSHINLLN